jgi:CubicO group peptidase (beta-lactamase class C family)
LQERGKLSVQDSICKYVAPCPEAWQPVTIHHLLSHTAGVPDFTGFPDYRKTMREPAPVESLITRFRALPLDFKPGETGSTVTPATSCSATSSRRCQASLTRASG